MKPEEKIEQLKKHIELLKEHHNKYCSCGCEIYSIDELDHTAKMDLAKKIKTKIKIVKKKVNNL